MDDLPILNKYFEEGKYIIKTIRQFLERFGLIVTANIAVNAPTKPALL